MRKVRGIIFISLLAGSLFLLSGCSGNTGNGKENSGTKETVPMESPENKEELQEESNKTEEKTEVVSDAGLTSEPVSESAISEEKDVKREKAFLALVKGIRKRYNKLSGKVEVSILSTEKQWEYAYFEPLVLYYEEIGKEGFGTLSKEEKINAEKGAGEVKKGLSEFVY